MGSVDTERIHVEIRGAVQGVGFRPFVYRIADELGLSGSVSNDGRGVVIEAEGPHEGLEELLRRLRTEHPAPASIDSMEHCRAEPTGVRGFVSASSVERMTRRRKS